MLDAPRIKLFISYARKDGRTLALLLRASLSSDYDVWLDTSEIEGGASWGSAIEQAIDGCQTVVALLSAGSYQSEICRAEQLRGLRKGKRVIPILVQANAERPIWLEGLNYRDFSDESAYDTCLVQLLADLTNGKYTAPPALIAPNTAPSLPPHFIPRREEIDRLRKAIISDATDRHVALTALHGMGGIGKSVMAAALCYDPAIQDAFPDGIFWIEIGREPSDLIEKMKVIGTKLGDAASSYTSKDLAVSSLRHLLVRKSVLIVLDDVWGRVAIEPFLANSPQSRWLVTTRDGHISTALGAAEVRLGTLTKDQALDLLHGWAGQHDPKHAEIAEALGYHPLAIKLVGARLKEGMSGQEWLESYHSIAQIKLRRRPTHTDESLQLCFEVSLDRLQSDDRPLYHALGIFPEDEWIPEGVAARLWRKLSPDLSMSDCADILLELDKLALMDRDVSHHKIRLHDLLHSYNQESLGEKYAAVQADFVATHPDLCALPDDYTWRFIGYHLIESGQATVLRSLLLDYRYLRAKLGASDVNALIADCDLLLKLGKDESIHVLRSALSMSAHVLHEDADALGHQLVGRMMGHRKANGELRAFTDSIPAQQPGLYPVDFDSGYVTHEQAGGYLLATLSGHTGGINGALGRVCKVIKWKNETL